MRIGDKVQLHMGTPGLDGPTGTIIKSITRPISS